MIIWCANPIFWAAENLKVWIKRHWIGWYLLTNATTWKGSSAKLQISQQVIVAIENYSHENGSHGALIDGPSRFWHTTKWDNPASIFWNTSTFQCSWRRERLWKEDRLEFQMIQSIERPLFFHPIHPIGMNIWVCQLNQTPTPKTYQYWVLQQFGNGTKTAASMVYSDIQQLYSFRPAWIDSSNLTKTARVSGCCLMGVYGPLQLWMWWSSTNSTGQKSRNPAGGSVHVAASAHHRQERNEMGDKSLGSVVWLWRFQSWRILNDLRENQI